VHSSLQHTSHRPWPLPEGQWRWRQTWRHLAFLHYRIPADTLRSLIPSEFTIQEFDGSAWIGVVPFQMADVMRGTLPGIWPLRQFPELNVRTYVERQGRPGVWFFSLDADCWPIVIGGRALYGLPYYKARMSLRQVGQTIAFESTRAAQNVRFSCQYQGVGEPFQASSGTFEHWMAERYCLYCRAGGSILRVDVHHRPWPLQKAEATIDRCDLFSAAGLSNPIENPICHFSSGVEVVSY